MLVQQMSPQEARTRADALAATMERSCLGVRVGRLHRLVTRRFEQSLRSHGLSISQLEVLSALLLVGRSAKPAELARLLVVERSTMSRNLAGMERRGLIRTTYTSATGRSQRFDIAPEGIAALATADSAWEDAQSSVGSSLGPHASTMLDRWLSDLTGESSAVSPS
jgi:DNA-binding MarR family transcriptional regulator